jgi:hypothetical protein
MKHLAARRQHPHAWTTSEYFLDHAPHLCKQALAGIEQDHGLRIP